MGIKRKLLPLLASGLLAGLTPTVAVRMPQPSAADLHALAAMNSVPGPKNGDATSFLRYWMFGTAAPSTDIWAAVAQAERAP